LTVVILGGCSHAEAQPRPIADSFAGPDGLITSERQPPPAESPWEMTSGSLFRSAGTGWTGRPDGGGTSGQNGSAVFRMVSKQRDFTDVDVSLTLQVVDLVQTDRTPAQAYDGVHLWVRYQSDKQLYAISVDRRDGTMLIKKKCQGGNDNGGTYYDLDTPVADAPIPFGQWQHVSASVRDEPDGSVTIDATRDGIALHANDKGTGCAPLRGGGGVGVRGDNAEFRMAAFTVDPVQ
jgi:hypothetical protein